LDVYLQDASVGAVSELTITYEEEVVYQGPPTTNYYLFEWSGIYTLGLEVTSGDGCTVNEPNLEVITVHPEPFALFEMVPYDAGAGPDIPSSLNTQWTFLNLSNDNSLNYWQFGDGAVSTEVSPIHKYNDPGVYGVSLLVTNDFGCTSTHSEWVVIEEQTPVYVPNSFTPGGVTSKPDGLNDAFRAEFRDYELITDYSLQIFDRWGELIWESSDPEEFWRGNVRRDGYESEHFVKLDVYTWKIRYSSIAMKGTHRELTGHVTIVR
jgi:gliding motility-associated-like protein